MENSSKSVCALLSAMEVGEVLSQVWVAREFADVLSQLMDYHRNQLLSFR